MNLIIAYTGPVLKRVACIGLIYNDHTIIPNSRTERERVLDLWMNAGKWFVSEADKIKETIDVSVVGVSDPYVDHISQSRDIDSGIFSVSGENCEHPVWTPEQNISFRIWHDVIGHHESSAGFDMMGEIGVLGYSLQHSPYAFREVLMVESLGQLSFAHINNGFGDQKCFGSNDIERIWSL